MDLNKSNKLAPNKVESLGHNFIIIVPNSEKKNQKKNTGRYATYLKCLTRQITQCFRVLKTKTKVGNYHHRQLKSKSMSTCCCCCMIELCDILAQTLPFPTPPLSLCLLSLTLLRARVRTYVHICVCSCPQHQRVYRNYYTRKTASSSCSFRPGYLPFVRSATDCEEKKKGRKGCSPMVDDDDDDEQEVEEKKKVPLE